MESVIKTPMDYQESLVFRRLAEWFDPAAPDLVRAAYVYHGIFRDLAYLAREGRDPGRVTPAEVGLFHKVIARATEKVDALWAALVATEAAPYGMFIQDGEDVVCVAFAKVNAHISPNAQTKESRGGVMKAFYAEVKRGESESFQMMLGIDAKHLVDANGAALVKRVKWFIVACDGALGKRTRPGYHYSRELVQNAVQILTKYTNAEAFTICQYIAKNRMHPALNGMATEALLPIFETVKETMAS
jgi:hypothetical protein